MLNRALRVLDGDIIIKLGFFISDLHRDIEKLHKEQFSNINSNQTLTLYRGQGVTKDNLNKMKQINGGLLAFNCFLSTSKNRQTAFDFAQEVLVNPDLVGILFIMNVDPHRSRTPFASVASVGCFGDDEQEVLFSMHTVFRLDEITAINKNSRLYEVHLTLTGDNDKDLCTLTERIRKEAGGATGWDQLGELLLKMGQPAKAQQVYETLLEQPANEIEEAHFYHQLGMANYHLGDYKEALTFYENAFKIRQKLSSPTHGDLAKTFNWIGNTNQKMGEYKKALASHEKALAIQKQLLSSDHPDLGQSYNNIGNVYLNMSEYPRALSSYEKALEIWQQSLPLNHPDLAKVYNNIGLVYSNIGECSKALSSQKKALAIRKRSLPSNHPDLAKSYNNIGLVYEDMKNYSKAVSYYERAIEIGKQSLTVDHPDQQMYEKQFGHCKKEIVFLLRLPFCFYSMEEK